KNAVAAHDLGLFDRYVDVDSCANGFVDDALGQVADGAKSLVGQQGSNLFGPAAQQIAQGLVTMLKPTLVTAIKGRVRDYVGGGNAQSPVPVDTPTIPGANLEQKAREEGYTFDGIESVDQEGSTALVRLKFLKANDPTKFLTVELKMRQVEGHWQVIRWNNVGDVLKELGGRAGE
ncbi:MAG: hypothetical protein M3Y56_05330, partial [Armatimonadota bacterium]|nr:hypothetical protein [Armatimonadota bacterium]